MKISFVSGSYGDDKILNLRISSSSNSTILQKRIQKSFSILENREEKSLKICVDEDLLITIDTERGLTLDQPFSNPWQYVAGWYNRPCDKVEQIESLRRNLPDKDGVYTLDDLTLLIQPTNSGL